ncbi:MAG: Lin0512 family protein [Deltaproteobacteria bacterium]|jgi:uncharacterized protein (TIGR02058 family)|nr:Lin0512 family protein [Deltaproteobacteria bacterium]
MNLKRFIVEFGTGADLHGQDVTKAAKRAIKDAVSHSCLCGLMDIFNFDHPDRMYIRLKVAAPHPERLDLQEIRKAVPFGQVEIEVVEGGMETEGLNVPSLGAGDRIVIVVASLTVLVDLDQHPIKNKS